MSLKGASGAPGLFAIGGLGGSGTRAAALLARNCGCWLGDDLNSALDTLSFTLLFKRASALTDTDAQFGALFDLFVARLTGAPVTREAAEGLARLARHERFGHTAGWLAARLEHFAGPARPPANPIRCGWKEPNTHIVIERLFRLAPTLKYVHVVRDPGYMATSRNQNQLRHWGPVLLDRPVIPGVRDAVAFWVAAHRRLEVLFAEYPGRILFLSHDALMDDPDHEALRLASFLDLDPPGDREALLRDLVITPPCHPPEAEIAAHADREDLEYCQAFMARFFSGGANHHSL